MKKSKQLYSIFLPIIFGVGVLGIVFNTLALSLAYSSDISNIRVSSPFSILFIVFTSLSFIAPIVLAVLSKETKIITRTKSGSIFSKVASAIVIISIVTLMVYDAIILIKEFNLANEIFKASFEATLGDCLKQYFEVWRLFRVLLTIPFVGHLILLYLPKNAKMSPTIKAPLHMGAILWCIVTPIIIYFYGGTPPMPEYFRVTFSIMFILFTLFLLFDFKWIYFESSIRVYSALTAITFSFAFIISLGTLIGIIANRGVLTLTEISVSVFEIVASLSLAIYILSKWLEISNTVNIVFKKEQEANK